MSAAAPAPAGAHGHAWAGAPPRHDAPDHEACPLCGAPLQADQDWCLRCGAAARTRLAAAPNWRVPVTLLAVFVALSLGVLVAALVKLAGDSGTPPTLTRTVTAPVAAAPPATTTPAPGATAATPGQATPPASTTPTASTPKATTPTTPPRGFGGLIEKRIREQQRTRTGK